MNENLNFFEALWLKAKYTQNLRMAQSHCEIYMCHQEWENYEEGQKPIGKKGELVRNAGNDGSKMLYILIFLRDEHC